MQKKLLEQSSDSYAPTTIPKEKYAYLAKRRNRLLLFTFGAVVGIAVVSATPHFLINRSVRRLYYTYCRGKVLDLSPKLYDEADCTLYELSRAVRVEYLVSQKVVDDGHYRIDESLPPEEQEERRRAMTLDFMTKNDHHWVGSPVTFAVVEKSEVQKPDFQRYNTVVIRDELMSHSTDSARRLFDSASEYIDKDGYLLVMDFGKSSYPMLDRWARWFNRKTNSSMSFSHDYHLWIQEGMTYDIVEEHRCLLGFHYSLALRPKQNAVPTPPAWE